MPKAWIEHSEAAVAVVRFANPDSGGVMDAEMERDFGACIDAIEADGALRTVVLTGATPGMFIRHYSLAELEGRARAMQARGLTFSLDRTTPEIGLLRTLRRIVESPRIYVAAINGTAMGGGFETALACDLRLVQAGDYPLGLPESNLGLLPGAGGTQRLTRLIGESRALAMMLLGQTIAPAVAVQYGLALEATEGPVLERALQIARALARKPAVALAHIKYLSRRASAGDAAQGLAEERTLFCDLMVQDETIQLMADANAGRRTILDQP